MSTIFTVRQVLLDKWWIGVLALLVALIVTPIVRFIAYRFDVVDRPDAKLKPHARPVAYLGGLAICAGLLAGLAAFAAIMPDAEAHRENLLAHARSMNLAELMNNPFWRLGAIAVSCLLITLVGLMDDLWSLKPWQKVLGQVTSGLVLVLGGVGQRMAAILFTGTPIMPPDWVLIPLSIAMCITIIVMASNASNLLDGLDGLCGGVTGIIALGFLALAVWLALWGHQPVLDELRVAVCLAMAGAVIGFLPYNIPPASIFMGDAGSMLLGFFVAVMMALFCQESNARWFIASWAVFALPVLDTALAVVRRLSAGMNIFAGDRSHLYDQLVDRGMTIKQVVGLFYLLAVIAAAIGVTTAVVMRTRGALILYLILLVAIWTVFYRLGMIAPKPKASAGCGEGTGSVDE